MPTKRKTKTKSRSKTQSRSTLQLKSRPQPQPRPPPAPPAKEGPFAGFAKDAMGFWHELASEMNRDWFIANKARYEAQWVQPMQALLDDVARRLARAYRPLALGAPKVMRIHRDVRF